MKEGALQRLRQIRKELTRGFEDYSEGYCVVASNLVEWALKFPRVLTYFKTPSGCFSHYLNQDPESEMYVDLAARQFDPDLPDIHIFSGNSPEAERYLFLHRLES